MAVLLSATGLFGQQNMPSNFFFTKLSNGLEVLVIEDNSVPLATIELCVHNGAYCESPDYDGLSHLYEHMFFKANKDIPSQELFMKRVQELGISFNGTTSNERVNYFITLGNQKLTEGLTFMNSAIRYPLFLEEEMKKENPVVDGEFQRAESNPVFFLLKDMDHALWDTLYSRKNTIGDHDIILTATPAKMRIIQEKYYYPNNSIIVIAGDVKHEAVFKQVQDIYGDWKASDFDPLVKFPIPTFPPLKTSKSFVTTNDNAQVPIILRSYYGPDTRGDINATYAADVFSYILSQKSSKLQQELVDKGIAYQVQVGYSTLKYVGPIQIFLVPNPMKIKEAYKILLKHIDMWDSEDYFTDEQLETAKTMLAIQDAYSKESTSEFVSQLTYWWSSASIDYYTSYVDNLKKVSRQDIQAYVRKYIKGQNYVDGLLTSTTLIENTGVKNFESLR
ncbi:pitrilysin family protein [soil metagenome]